MIGDLIFAIILLLLFVIEIMIGTVIINSASGLTPVLRKSDNELAISYDQFYLAGQLSLYTGIIGLLVIVGSLFVLGLKPQAFDGLPRWSRITIKSVFLVGVIILALLTSYYLYEACKSILISHTYKLSRFGARQEFDDAIWSARMTAGFYIVLAGIFTLVLVSMDIYDSTKEDRELIIVETMYM